MDSENGSNDFKTNIENDSSERNLTLVQLAPVQPCRELSCKQNPPIDDSTARDILPVLLHCLSREVNPELQLEAVRVLENIAGTSAQRHEDVIAGALPPLIKLLKSPCDDVREHALWALGDIIGDDVEIRDRVIELGVMEQIPSLVKTDTSIQFLRIVTAVILKLFHCVGSLPSVKAIQAVLPTLNELIMYSDNEILRDTVQTIVLLHAGVLPKWDRIQLVIETRIVPELVPLLIHRDEEVQRAALEVVRDILSGTVKQKQVLLDCGVLSYFLALISHQLVTESDIVAKLVPLLSHDDEDLQEEASKAFCYIVTTEDLKQVALDCDALSNLSALMSHQNKTINRNAVCTLANILAGNERQKQAVIEAGLLPKIVEHLAKKDTDLQRVTATALYNLSINGTTEQVAALIGCGVILSLCSLLTCAETRVVVVIFVTSMAIANLLNGDRHCERIQLVLESGIFAELTSLLAHEDEEVQHVALLIISKIVTGTEEQKQVVLDCGALSHFSALLSHPKKQICIHAVLILSNITFGNAYSIQAVIDAGLLALIVEHLGEGPLETQNSAPWVVHNASNNGTTEQVVTLISCGVIPALCNLLTNSNLQMVHNVLESLSNMLKKTGKLVASEIEECGGVNMIHALKSHEEVEISKEASHIMKKYFDDKISWWRCCYARRLSLNKNV